MREQTFKGKTVTVESKIGHAARLAAAIFAFQEWTYTLAPGNVVPNRKELANTITHLLRSVAEGGRSASTGRLYVVWNEDFNQYEIMLEIGTLSSQELFEETGIDKKVGLTEES